MFTQNSERALNAGAEFPLDIVVRSGQSFSSTATLRPGAAPAIVQITSSNTAAGTVTPTQVVFAPNESSKTATFRAIAAGATVVALSVPAGFADPGAQRQINFSVNAQQIQPNELLRAVNLLVRNFNFVRNSNSTAQTVTFTSSDPLRMQLWDPATQSSSGTRTVTFAVGVSTVIVGLVGRAPTGSVVLQVTGGGLSPMSFDVPLRPSGFVLSFQSGSEQVPVLPVGRAINVGISAQALDPVTLRPVENLQLWPGAGVARINVTSSNPAVGRVQGVPLAYPFGVSGAGITVDGLSPGTVSLTLEQPAGFITPSTGGSVTLRVQ